jgi:uncharacterized protein
MACCLLPFVFNLGAQDTVETENDHFAFIVQNNPIGQHAQDIDKKPKTLKYHGDMAFAFLTFIRTYQILVSSQQNNNVCVFHPSCSHFGQESIREFGFFKGLMFTSDRLQRCHSLASEHYLSDHGRQKLLDPVENYKFKRSE